MNTKWVLILTLFGPMGHYDDSSVSVTSVPGFASQQLCQAAANEWLGQMRRTKSYDNPRIGKPTVRNQPWAYEATCVRSE